MKSWLIPSLLLLIATVVAGGAGWGASMLVGMNIGLGENERLEPLNTDSSAPSSASEPTAASTSSTPASTPSRAKSRRSYIDGIMARNIFDSEALGVAAPESCEGPDCEFAETDLSVKLLGTIVAVPEAFSSALLYDENAKMTGGYGIGDKILDATIIRIEDKRVVIQRADGTEEVLNATEVDTGSGKPRSSVPPPDDEGVSKVSDTEFVLSREMVDTALGDLDSLSKMARARPHKDSSGNPDGFRMSGVRRNKLGYKIGLRSGDVIHSVNGQPLTSLTEAMGAMDSLKNGSNFEFEITRRGEKKTLKYSVR